MNYRLRHYYNANKIKKFQKTHSLSRNGILPIVYQDLWCSTMEHHDRFVGISCHQMAYSYVHVETDYPIFDNFDQRAWFRKRYLNKIIFGVSYTVKDKKITARGESIQTIKLP